MIKLDPSTGVRVTLNAQRADAPLPGGVDLDMEFAAEGGEGPTPYEVLLLAAMEGRSVRFTRQDTDRGGVAGDAAAHRPAPARPPVRAGIVGTRRRRRARRRLRRLARSVADESPSTLTA